MLIRLATPNQDALLGLPRDELISLAATRLQEFTRQNTAGTGEEGKGVVTRFHTKILPSLEVESYLKRLVVYTPFSKDALLLALRTLDVISRLDPTSAALFPSISYSQHDSIPFPTPTVSPIPLINAYTFHRLLLSTLLVSAKFISDAYISQARVAKTGGVQTREMGRLEMEILKLMGWNLFTWSIEDLEAIAGCLLAGRSTPMATEMKAEQEFIQFKPVPTPSTSDPAKMHPNPILIAPQFVRTSSSTSFHSSTTSSPVPLRLFSPPLTPLGDNPPSPTPSSPPSSPPTPQRRSSTEEDRTVKLDVGAINEQCKSFDEGVQGLEIVDSIIA